MITERTFFDNVENPAALTPIRHLDSALNDAGVKG
jgi:hypothetical protein